MKNGFTLLELAIVLAIIGLIAGGIVAGSSMIRSAELRSLITELSQIRTSIATFQTKYNELPGDMTNAERIWGAASSCPSGSSTATGTQTCNGDGDGMIERATGASSFGELFTFWKHLENAKMINGTYTGRSSTGGPVHSVAENVFNSKMQNGLITTFNVNGITSGHTEWFDGEYRKNYLQFSGDDPAGTTSPSIPLLTPTETWKIDTKFDDGKPGLGIVMERHWDDCTDASASSDLTADYLLSEAGKVCIPIFYGLF